MVWILSYLLNNFNKYLVLSEKFMVKYLFPLIILFSLNTFSQNGTNYIHIDSTNVERYFEEFCKSAIKDEFEKIKDYQARIQNLNEQKIGSGLFLEFVQEIEYDPNSFNYDAEFERYFMAQHKANISVKNEFNHFVDTENIVIELYTKEILMTLQQKKLGLFGAYKDYIIASKVDYDEYENINEDELGPRIFIYMPIDEAKAFKKGQSKIALRMRMKIESFADSKIFNKSEFFPSSEDKLTEHTYYIIKGDIQEIMFYDINTNKIYTTYSHSLEE